MQANDIERGAETVDNHFEIKFDENENSFYEDIKDAVYFISILLSLSSLVVLMVT
jgi:hypothetical protein